MIHPLVGQNREDIFKDYKTRPKEGCDQKASSDRKEKSILRCCRTLEATKDALTIRSGMTNETYWCYKEIYEEPKMDG